MRLFALALGAGIALGYVRHGRIQSVVRLPWMTPAILLVWLALAVQLMSGALPADAKDVNLRLWASALSYCSIGMALLYAWRALVKRPAMTASARAVQIIFVGWLANFIVIVVNGGMPVSRRALELAGKDPNRDVESGDLFKHVPASHETDLLFLGDVIPVPFLRMVVSPGDIILGVGIALFVSGAMTVTAGRRAEAAPIARPPTG